MSNGESPAATAGVPVVRVTTAMLVATRAELARMASPARRRVPPVRCCPWCVYPRAFLVPWSWSVGLGGAKPGGGVRREPVAVERAAGQPELLVLGEVHGRRREVGDTDEARVAGESQHPVGGR